MSSNKKITVDSNECFKSKFNVNSENGGDLMMVGGYGINKLVFIETAIDK